MTSKADFNAEEWATIAEAPLLAGVRVVAAERGGAIRESIAMSKVYTAARESQGASALLDELVAAPPAVDPQRLKAGAGSDPSALSAERLRTAIQLLNEKATPEDVSAYKQFVLALAQAAAEAHKEGGFIGIGGKPISPKEQAALDELRAVLDGGGQ